MNKDVISKVVIFATGAAIGSVVTWRLLKTTYERIAQEEIDSVKEMFTVPKEATEDCDNTEEYVEKPKTAKDEYKEFVADLGYGDDEEVDNMEKPYVISPDEFGDIDGYGTVTLVYYADEVLTDEMDEPIDDIESIVGVDSLSHFGEYEEDTVYVRNDRLKCDYEIQLDTRNFSDVVTM